MFRSNIASKLLVLIAVAVQVHSQETPAPSFEAVSIRPDISGYTLLPNGKKIYPAQVEGRSMFFGCHGTDVADRESVPVGRCLGSRTTVRMLFSYAHDEAREISGGPEWMESEAYAIDAKAESPATRQQLREMIRTLLAERFKLQFHRETRQADGFVLTVAKNGPKLKEATGQEEPPFGLRTSLNMEAGTLQTKITAVNYDFAEFVAALSSYVERPIQNLAGLRGKYNFTLGPFVRLDTPNASGVSILTVVQEQLGLRLESQKVPILVYVIDHLEKPTED